MMTPTNAFDEESNGKVNSAILEVSSMSAGGIVKQESRDVDILSNYSTSVEGSVVST